MTGLPRRLFGLFAFLLAMIALAPPATAAGPTCSGKFVNPITDVCWSCLFPLSVGALRIWPSDTVHFLRNELCIYCDRSAVHCTKRMPPI